MRAIALFMALCIAAPAAAQQQDTASRGAPRAWRSTVTAGGEGDARVTPDRAVLSIGVETHGVTAQQASAENARRQTAVIDAVRKLGITDAQISTIGYNVYPEQRYEPTKGDSAPRIVGYSVSNTVRVEVRKLDQLGAVIDAALAKGANTINSLDFSASSEDSARHTALASAVERARADAEALARGAGGRLGELLELTSQTGGASPRPMPMGLNMAQAKIATPISPGEQTVTVSVVGRWAFIAGDK